MNKERIITSIPIIGLDQSSPDNMAPQGSCLTLHNLRYINNAWRPIVPQKTLYGIEQSQGYSLRILYHHPVCPDNVFIAITETDGMKDLVVVTIEDGSTTEEIVSNAIILLSDFGSGSLTIEEEPVTVSHFGKVLIILVDGKVHYFVWDQLKLQYNKYTTPQPVEILEYASYGAGVGVGYAAFTNLSESGKAYDIWRIYDIENNLEERAVSEENSNMWWGELCYLVCYKMADGTIVSPSELRILCSEGEENREWLFAKLKMDDTLYLPDAWCMMFENTDYNGVPEDRRETYTSRLRKFLPSIAVTLPENIKNNPLIDRVAIYATRINTIYDYKKLSDSRNAFYGTLRASTENGKNFVKLEVEPTAQSISITEAYADNRLPEQPLYLVEEKKIEEIDDDIWTVELGYDKLKNITSQVDIYTPNQSLHEIVPTTLFEYNERLHLADITTNMFKGYTNIDFYVRNSVFRDPFYIVELTNGITIQGSMRLVDTDTEDKHSAVVINGKIISYPDARANKIRLYARYTDTTVKALATRPEFTLAAAAANNFAYFILPPTKGAKYSELSKLNMSAIVEPATNPIYTESNRLQVSAAGNCLNLPFDTSYKIGDIETHIKSINTVSEMLADSRFGETPLYVFTDKGIWAAIVGSGEVVYSNWAFINFDRITLTRTTAANGVVFYVTERGIHALEGRKATLISQPIESPDRSEPRNYADLWLNHKYNELIVDVSSWEEDSRPSFVYSLDSGRWYSRNYQGQKINENFLIFDQGTMLYVLDSEVDCTYNTTTAAKIVTRPFELSPMRYTRIESLWARWARYDDDTLPTIVIIEGASSPTGKWKTLRKIETTDKELGIIRWVSSSARWYRITLLVTGSQNASFTHIDIEHYIKYLRRLR